MYDIVVVGGGTAGCAAAYIGAKLGLKVLLLEKTSVLGGTMTSGLVIPIMKSGENQINTDFYNDLIKNMKEFGGQITYQNNSGWLNPEILKIVLDRMLAKVGVDIRFNSTVYKIDHNSSHIHTLYINKKILLPCIDVIDIDNKTLFEPIETRYIIDSTGNCEIGKILNCEFLKDNFENQPASLRFIMSGVDLSTFSKWLMDYDKDRTVTTCEVIEGNIHLSTAYTWDTNKKWALTPLFEDAVEKGILNSSDTNYFQIFTVAGTADSVAFNCPRLINSDFEYNDVEDVTNAYRTARSAIYRLSEFCRLYFPGFEKAYISNISDMLGIRASNRIKGKYIYTEEDLISGKKFKNPAVISNYPIDIHSANKNKSTLRQTEEYQLPIEALMSNDYDNLFVAGRCLSADYKAQGALRVQASCFSMGEAVAKYIVKNI